MDKRWLKHSWMVTLLGILPLSAVHADTTCDKSNPPICCETWAIEVTDSRTGKSQGSVFSMKDTYEAKVRAREQAVKTDAYLCKGLGPNDSDCFHVYGPPYCRGGASSHSARGSRNLPPAPVATAKKNDPALIEQALFSRIKPNSTGYCAKAINDALLAAGTRIPVAFKNEDGQWSRPDAYQLGWFLEQAGFRALPAASYTPDAFRDGDIVVFQPIAGHKHGHVAVYNALSGQWMSDFLQNSFNVDKHGGYNLSEYHVYRSPQP